MGEDQPTSLAHDVDADDAHVFCGGTGKHATRIFNPFAAKCRAFAPPRGLRCCREQTPDRLQVHSNVPEPARMGLQNHLQGDMFQYSQHWYNQKAAVAIDHAPR